MASITLTIPDEQVPRVVNTFADYHAYRNTIPNPKYDPAKPVVPETIDNPQTKIQFLKQHLVDVVRKAVRAQEDSVAILAARAAVEDVAGIE